MSVKDKIRIMINIYTRVVSCIFLMISVYVLFLFGSSTIRLYDVVGVNLIGLISAIAFLPLMPDKELSKRKMIIMNAVYFLVINISVFIIGYFLHWFYFKYVQSFITIEIMIIAVYVLTMFISYKVDSNEASKINEKLKERNK